MVVISNKYSVVRKTVLIHLFLILCSLSGLAQITNIVILEKDEIRNLKEIISKNNTVKLMYDSVYYTAEQALKRNPQPVEVIKYEGLLENNPARIKTTESLKDADAVVSLIYAGYGKKDSRFGLKVKDFVLAWAEIYKPNGNPINENKLNAFFWGYFLFRKQFTKKEREKTENWLLEIAEKEMNNKNVPNNNWEAKRLKITGTIGCILNNEKLKNHSYEGFKKYINTAYFADGTSNDLETRDALHYHISGLTPCISAFINLSKFDRRFDLFEYESETGSSVKKSVEYVVPFATGEKQRKEWTNSKVKLDRERAAAGFAEYQPGKLYEPENAYQMFEWACYYKPEWFSVFEKSKTEKYTATWIGLLNSPLIRK